ncbi:TetR/AcrR family transcriptional regulator [Hoyosella rhizosphaerae]|uniref:TetR family transcriptional regulator n=1 Tax=Hoyosella rhizosphaerae TaxID=1755582 RepID=A0A916U608_9ACTN|nr:TetR/AcrR family transcriptional regulator [Hoyosella rhizosphaerae]MBN4926269.1 TetR/AcrR family transcriptional regulator [Hoyosella rhizosphaerae]GGC60732.1 TetR family transcriptional regulator [Hoyosella rhizosphaerae]
MATERHNTIDENAVLDAARACVIAVGWKRTTLTDVARRAGVSRMSIYRKWDDMGRLMGDVMTREWTGLQGLRDLITADRAVLEERLTPEGLSDTFLDILESLRTNDLFTKVIDVDPELLLPYIIGRRGRTQNTAIAAVEHAIRTGQQLGTIRPGDPTSIAHTIVLAAQSWLLSSRIMTKPVSLDDLIVEQRELLIRYLRP